MYPFMYLEICFNRYYRVCVLIKIAKNMFNFNINFFKNYSDMCEIKTVLNVAALLLAATGFCINQVNSEKKVGHHSGNESECLCEEEYKKYCLNGGEC